MSAGADSADLPIGRAGAGFSVSKALIAGYVFALLVGPVALGALDTVFCTYDKRKNEQGHRKSTVLILEF